MRSIEPDDFKSRLRHRDEDPASAAAQLEDRRSGRPSLLDVESNIPIDARSDLIVIDGALARVFRVFQSDRSSGSFEQSAIQCQRQKRNVSITSSTGCPRSS